MNIFLNQEDISEAKAFIFTAVNFCTQIIVQCCQLAAFLNRLLP